MDATPGLIELLNEIRDPRRAEGKRHPLPAVLSLLILAMMAGMRGLQGVVDFGRNLPADIVQALGFKHPKTLAKSTLSIILRARKPSPRETRGVPTRQDDRSIRPKRASRPFDASVDPTEARSL
jgi:hypothetical protein